ncbi:MAG: hypothetical protein DHS20C02_15100 [Micavibrio sp.]|nr:MAG: hypothetical protein DHS20C02_15100 [Micavibrio sp.]
MTAAMHFATSQEPTPSIHQKIIEISELCGCSNYSEPNDDSSTIQSKRRKRIEEIAIKMVELVKIANEESVNVPATLFYSISTKHYNAAPEIGLKIIQSSTQNQTLQNDPSFQSWLEETILDEYMEDLSKHRPAYTAKLCLIASKCEGLDKLTQIHAQTLYETYLKRSGLNAQQILQQPTLLDFSSSLKAMQVEPEKLTHDGQR